jgi:hypothetical protein
MQFDMRETWLTFALLFALALPTPGQEAQAVIVVGAGSIDGWTTEINCQIRQTPRWASSFRGARRTNSYAPATAPGRYS